MVYQDPATALSPAMRIGDQVAEVFRYHEGLPKEEALGSARESLRQCGAARPRRDHAPLPVRALGRPAAARGHRHGARRQPAPARARRAHYRSRRHGRGRDPRPDRGAARPHSRLHPVDHAQPGVGRTPLRARRRALRGAPCRRGAGARGLHRPASPLHHGPAALRPEVRHEQDRRRAADDPRHAAGARRAARRLRLLGALPHGQAGLHPPRTRPLRVARRRRTNRPRRGRGHAARPGGVLAASRSPRRRVGAARALLLLRRGRRDAAHHAGAGHQPRGQGRRRGRRARDRRTEPHVQGRPQEAHRRERRVAEPAPR